MLSVLCDERQRLIIDYRNTASQYADSVREFSEANPNAESHFLRQACRVAWSAAEQSRLALSRHEADHGCNRTDFMKAVAAGV